VLKYVAQVKVLSNVGLSSLRTFASMLQCKLQCVLQRVVVCVAVCIAVRVEVYCTSQSVEQRQPLKTSHSFNPVAVCVAVCVAACCSVCCSVHCNAC